MKISKCSLQVAHISILHLSLGDPLASFFGIRYGKSSFVFPNGKSLIGGDDQDSARAMP